MVKVGTIFREFLKLILRYQFDGSVERYQDDHYCKSFSASQR